MEAHTSVNTWLNEDEEGRWVIMLPEVDGFLLMKNLNNCLLLTGDVQIAFLKRLIRATVVEEEGKAEDHKTEIEDLARKSKTIKKKSKG